MINVKKGFTLIELLVVIAVIGLLSTIVLVSLGGTRAKARDTRRVQELREIQKAVELYYNKYQTYPQPAGGYGTWSGHCPSYGNYNTYILGLGPWLPTLPIDPIYDVGGQCYLYNSDGTDYIIITHFTMETICEGDPSNACNPSYIQQMDRRCCTQPTIAVYSSGAINW